MELYAFEVLRPPSWIFPLPVWSHSTSISSSGMLDLKNVGLAVGIPSISHLIAKTYAFKVFYIRK